MKIMCVDDEPLALQMLELSVKKVRPDAEVLAYRKPRELLEAAKENGCDIAFLDIHMRGMDGVELARELKAVNPKMNIIFVTGFSDYTGEAMSLHASGYIMKPVNKEKIEQELAESIIDRHVGQFFDQSSRDFTGKTVQPVCTGFEIKDGFGHCGDVFLYRIVTLFPKRLHAFLHGTLSGIIGRCRTVAVGKAAFHGQDVAYVNRPFGGNDTQRSVARTDEFARLLPFGQPSGDRVSQIEQTFLIQHHHDSVERDLG